jgi:CBS domain-containing protein
MPDEQQLASASLSFETAAEHVLTRVPRASPKSLVEEIRRSLLGDRYDGLTHVAILDGAKLAGILTIETLFSAPKGSVAQEVMDPDPSIVVPGTDQEVAAWQAARRGESALAVVDEEDDFLGFVPPHRLLPCCSGSTRRTWIVWVDSLGAPPKPAEQAANQKDVAFGTDCPGSWSVL